MLQDKHHRIHDYLRISLTDSCNFRCAYCMPNEHIETLPNQHLMQPDEIFQIAKTFVSLGVKKIRLTGGEPLVRKEFSKIITDLSKLPVELTLTSNGVLIDQYVSLFKQIGIHSINISLDTLERSKFLSLTRRDSFDKVWQNILLFLENGFGVKINVVVMKNINSNEVFDFIQLTKALPLHIRFIEYMPFDQNGWDKNKVMLANEMLQNVNEKFKIEKLIDQKHDTAKKYKVVDFKGTFAFITTMSQPFCQDCNRMRITADGKMKNCLFGIDELDLLSAYRKNEDIEPIIHKTLGLKHKTMGGQFEKTYLETNPSLLQNRSMIKIGG